MMVILSFLLLGLLFLGHIVGKTTRRSYAIKYDCQDRKLFLGIAIIFTILSVCMILFSELPIMDVVTLEFMIVLIMLGGFLCFPVIAFMAWMGFLSSTLYLRRLKIYGYEIPRNKKIFSSRLDMLGKTGDSLVNPDSQSKESMVLAAISVSIFAGVFINAVVFYFQYRELEDLAYFGVYGSIPFLLFWLIIACVFWRQRLRDKYKDDVESDEKRKTRKHIEKGIIEIVIYLFLTIMWITMLYNGVEYIYKSRLQAGFYQ